MVNSKIINKLKNRTAFKIHECKECKECNYNIWCNGGCASSVLINFNDIMHKDEIKSTINQTLIKGAFNKIVENDISYDHISHISKPWEGEDND